jgi:Family of unknown function (DUF6152)
MHRRTLILTLAGLPASLPLAAHAHHGWTWAEADLGTLEGIIRAVTIAPPHPELQVEAEDGTMWTVELGNPARTESAGFVEGTAVPGDAVTVLGNRSRDPQDLVVKAVRITLKGQNYDFYPERIPSGT